MTLIKKCLNKVFGKKEEKQDPNKHFINFKVVDENGKSLDGIVLLVELPDGSSEERTSDINGMIEIKNIEPGQCTFESDWKKAKVDNTVFIK
jgi:hypothetical protein